MFVRGNDAGIRFGRILYGLLTGRGCYTRFQEMFVSRRVQTAVSAAAHVRGNVCFPAASPTETPLSSHLYHKQFRVLRRLRLLILIFSGVDKSGVSEKAAALHGPKQYFPHFLRFGFFLHLVKFFYCFVRNRLLPFSVKDFLSSSADPLVLLSSRFGLSL